MCKFVLHSTIFPIRCIMAEMAFLGKLCSVKYSENSILFLIKEIKFNNRSNNNAILFDQFYQIGKQSFAIFSQILQLALFTLFPTPNLPNPPKKVFCNTNCFLKIISVFSNHYVFLTLKTLWGTNYPLKQIYNFTRKL